MDGKYTPRRIARVIEQSRPDVICIQELDHFRVSSGGIDQVHAIAEVLEANFQAIYNELEKHGNPAWAGVEANAGFPGSVVDWETYPPNHMEEHSTSDKMYVLEVVDKRAQLLDASDILEQAAGQDPYIFVREASRQSRRNQIKEKLAISDIMLLPSELESFGLAALEAMAEANQTPMEFMSRHVRGDWGDELCKEDRQLNDQALVDGSRILSAYKTRKGVKIWIITEAMGDDGHRAATTCLLPEEY